jgi:hypothetical protein
MLVRAALTVVAAILLVACSHSNSPADDDHDTHANTADCAPNDSRAWQQIAFKARDTDGDGAVASAPGQLCAGASLPAGYFADTPQPANADCDDADLARWAIRAFASRDADNDTHRVNESGTLCTGAALPAGYFADAVDVNAADCNDADAARWLNVPFLGRDHDADGFPTDESGSLCQGNATLPTGYFAAVSAQLRDCNDLDATRWRVAAVYRDQDGDGVGAGAWTFPCLGRSPPAGFSFKGFDPNDNAADPSAALVSDFDIPPPMREPPQEADDED